MVPNVERGYSFKGVTAYLTHDARENENEPHPETSGRVSFFKLRNFIGDEARTPEEAAKIMALIVRDADKLKRDAGIAATGRKATAPPVYHFSLSWHPTEQPGQAEIERAAEAFLKRYGLDEGYLSYIVGHNDTDHVHIHGVVCLVDPVTGKQANPYFDKQKAQAWGAQYERQQGKIFCHNREARLGAIERARPSHATQTRAAFNDNSKGAAQAKEAKPDRFGRSRERTREPRQPRQSRQGQSRTEWQARQDKSREGREAADRIKADTGAKWSALKAAERAAFTQRSAEASRFYADRKAGREAIYEKYKSALDGIWKPEGGPKSAGTDRSGAWQSIRQQQEARQKVFEANERTALGRVRNALTLAGSDKSLFRSARLAVDAAERRRLFERGQREIVARILPRESQAKERPRPKTPEPKRVQAERVKAMRTKELAAYSRETMTQGAAMKARHEFQIRGEKDSRAMLSKEIGKAWEQHKTTYRPEQGKDSGAGQEKHGGGTKADRFGRSRDRQHDRAGTGTATDPELTERAGEFASNTESAGIDAKADFLAVSGPENPGGGTTTENEQTATAQPEAAQQPQSEEAARIAREIAAIDAEQARQEARQQDHGHDTGREMSR